MFGRFMPQEGKFFDLFNAHAEQLVQGGQALVALMDALSRCDEEAARHCETIDVVENRADTL